LPGKADFEFGAVPPPQRLKPDDERVVYVLLSAADLLKLFVLRRSYLIGSENALEADAPALRLDRIDRKDE
jgi:hypothetical protein